MKSKEPAESASADEPDESAVAIPAKSLPAGMIKTVHRIPPPAAPMNLDSIFASVDVEIDADDNAEDEYVDERHQHSTFSLMLQSRDAQHAWTGRPHTQERRGLPGIEWFIRKVGRLCRGVRDDDPYAIMSLADIEQQINNLRLALARNTEQLEGSLKSGETFGFSFKQPSLKNFTPFEYAVNPTNGYAFAACEMLARYDKVVTLALEARNLKLVNKLEFSQIRSRSPFNRLVQSVISYRYSGTTRSDFLQETQRALGAVEKYGPIDAAVLEPTATLLLMDIDPLPDTPASSAPVDPIDG